MNQKLKLIMVTILFVILSIFVAIGMIIGMETILHASPLKNCQSSYTLNLKNHQEYLIKRLEILPYTSWEKEIGIDRIKCNRNFCKDVEITSDGVLRINLHSLSLSLSTKLQKRVKELYERIVCEIENPEIELILGILRAEQSSN